VSFAWRSAFAVCLLALVGSCGAAHPEGLRPFGGAAEQARGAAGREVAPSSVGLAGAEPQGLLGLAPEYGAIDRILLGWSDDSWLYLPTYLELVHGLAAHAQLLVVVDGFEQQFFVAHELASYGVQLGSVEFVHAPLDSMWMRDYGPLVVHLEGGERRIMDAPYGRLHDDVVPKVVADKLGLPHADLSIEIDGGHLQTDGAGRCIVSEDVLAINSERGKGDGDVMEALRHELGCQQVILVPPLLLEDTGHVDVFLYVTGPGRLLLGRYRPLEDGENHRRLESTARALRAAGFAVDRIPMPANDRRKVFRSYTNALAANDAVFVPTYRRDRRFERAALSTYRRAFPGRTIIPVAADDIMDLGGALHCLAMTVMAP
jgi:agmatine deiminase